MAIINGTPGNDILNGTAADDTIVGSAGNDTLDGAGGKNTVDYGTLGQAITIGVAGKVNKGTAGNDTLNNFQTIIGATNLANTVDGTGAKGSANLDVNLATNTLQVRGLPIGELPFTINNFVNATGTQNNDNIIGSNTGGQLIGGGGTDTIRGGNGNDTINGTNGTIKGVGEVDTLTGSGGRDRFVLGDNNGAHYVGQGNNDYAMITDFNLFRDSLALGSARGNISFAVESSGTIDLFSGRNPNNRDLIAKIQVDLNPIGQTERATDPMLATSMRSVEGFNSTLNSTSGNPAGQDIGSLFNIV